MQRLDPSAALVAIDRGANHFRKSEFAEAIECYSEAIACNPDVHTGYTARGIAYLRSGKLDDALNDLNHAIKILPTSPLLYQIRGDIFLAKNEIAATIENYRQCAAFNEKSKTLAPTYFTHAQHDKSQGKINQALINTLLAIKIKPRNKLYRTFLKDILQDIKHGDDLNAIQKKTLFEAITNLPGAIQVPLLKLCKDPESPLGIITHRNEGIRPAISTANFLKKIDDRIASYSLSEDDFFLIENSPPNSINQISMFQSPKEEDELTASARNDDIELIEQFNKLK